MPDKGEERDDGDDMYAQRPGHFLTGEAIDLTIAGERLDHVRHSHDGTGLHHLHLDGRILIQG